MLINSYEFLLFGYCSQINLNKLNFVDTRFCLDSFIKIVGVFVPHFKNIDMKTVILKIYIQLHHPITKNNQNNQKAKRLFV